MLFGSKALVLFENITGQSAPMPWNGFSLRARKGGLFWWTEKQLVDVFEFLLELLIVTVLKGSSNGDVYLLSDMEWNLSNWSDYRHLTPVGLVFRLLVHGQLDDPRWMAVGMRAMRISPWAQLEFLPWRIVASALPSCGPNHDGMRDFDALEFFGDKQNHLYPSWRRFEHHHDHLMSRCLARLLTARFSMWVILVQKTEKIVDMDQSVG